MVTTNFCNNLNKKIKITKTNYNFRNSWHKCNKMIYTRAKTSLLEASMWIQLPAPNVGQERRRRDGGLAKDFYFILRESKSKIVCCMKLIVMLVI